MNSKKTPTSEEIEKQARSTVSLFFGATIILFLSVIALVAAHAPPLVWGVSIVCTAFFGAGSVGGFLYSTYGDEEKTFSPVMTALTTALGGASLADGLNRNGMLRRVYHVLGNAAGLDEQHHGVVLALALVFAPLGFFTLYFYRRLVVNRLVRQGDAVEAQQIEAERTALVPAGEIELDSTTDEAVFRSDPAARAAATEWLKRQSSAAPSFDDLMGDARAQIALEKYSDAIASLEKALLLRPGNAPATLLLAAVHVEDEDYQTAVDLLETIIRNDPGNVPLNAWKLLGYARLFDDPKSSGYRASLLRSIDASSKFLNAVPSDLGALLNRACAYGQLGPKDEQNRIHLFADLRELLAQEPDARENISRLLEPGFDFALWANDDGFKKVLSGSS